jgi:hypothetical protein
MPYCGGMRWHILRYPRRQRQDVRHDWRVPSPREERGEGIRAAHALRPFLPRHPRAGGAPSKFLTGCIHRQQLGGIPAVHAQHGSAMTPG